jgi:hypothetical protein
MGSPGFIAGEKTPDPFGRVRFPHEAEADKSATVPKKTRGGRPETQQGRESYENQSQHERHIRKQAAPGGFRKDG